jgi:hypothetical protein
MGGPLTASDLLDTYADLVRRLRWPDTTTDGLTDYLAFFMGRELAASRKAGQFYPVLPATSAVTPGQAAEFARHVGGALAGAPVYQVTAAAAEPAGPLMGRRWRAALREWASYEIGIPLVLDLAIAAGVAYLAWLLCAHL